MVQLLRSLGGGRGALSKELAPAAALLLATLLATWPWVVTLPTTSSQADASFTAIHLRHLQQWLTGDQPSPWTTRLSAPFQDTITASDWVLGEAVLGLPAYLLGAAPMVVHHGVAVLGLWLTALVAHWLARALTGPGWHTVAGAMVAALAPSALTHAHHVNLVQRYLVLGGALLLGLGLVRRRPLLALGGGLVAGLAWHFGLYSGLQAGVVLWLTALVGWVATREHGAALSGLAGWALVSVTSVPVWSRYASVASQDLQATVGPLHESGGLDLATLVLPRPEAALDWANPGYTAWLLVILGLVVLWRTRTERLRWPWLAVGMVALAGLLLALGSQTMVLGRALAPGPWALLVHLPGLEHLRDQPRWIALTHLALAPVAALGMGALVRWARDLRWRQALLLLVPLLLWAEWAPHRLDALEGGLDPIYAQLAQEPPGRLLDLALVEEGLPCGHDPAAALSGALTHDHELVGGTYARELDRDREIDGLLSRWPARPSQELLTHAGVDLVLIHGPPPQARSREMRCEALEGAHTLCRLQSRDLTRVRPEDLVASTVPGADGVRVHLSRLPPGHGGRSVRVRCGLGASRTYSLEAWRLITLARWGRVPDDRVEVIFDEPCEQPRIQVPVEWLQRVR